MKITGFVLFFIAATAYASGLKGESASKLIQNARRLGDEVDYTWINDFSLKYQGCHHIMQWNNQANGQDDVRMYQKRLVRFRTCPKDDCSATEAGGCQSGYGDYIVDMDMFLELYWEAKSEDQQIDCQNFRSNVCDCGDSDDQQTCYWECAVDYGKEDCIEGGNPNNRNAEEQINYEQFLTCAQLDVQKNEEGVQYYAGPYCAEQGGSIKIGVFTDDQCSNVATSSLYQLTGIDIKYTEESIVDEECTYCEQPQESQEGNGNAQDPREFCQVMYADAGKCESYLADVLGEDNINEQACNYLAGIKMVRTDGLLDLGEARPSAIATAFIVIFAMAFAAMAFYVWYLRTRLGVKKNSLL